MFRNKRLKNGRPMLYRYSSSIKQYGTILYICLHSIRPVHVINYISKTQMSYQLHCPLVHKKSISGRTQSNGRPAQKRFLQNEHFAPTKPLSVVSAPAARGGERWRAEGAVNARRDIKGHRVGLSGGAG